MRSAQLESNSMGFINPGSFVSRDRRTGYMVHENGSGLQTIGLYSDVECAATEWRLLTQEVTFSYKGRYKVFSSF